MITKVYTYTSQSGNFKKNLILLILYSAFQIDELYRHNQNLVGTLHATSLLCSRDMKTAVKIRVPILEAFWHSPLTIV